MQEFLNQSILEFGDYFQLDLGSLFYVAVYFIITYLSYRWIKRLANLSANKARIKPRQANAIIQVSKYILFSIFLVMSMDALNVHLKYLLALTPLLVGLGLGIQQLFNDLVSGVILLIEPNINIGDIVEIDGHIAHVKEIGIRSSKIQNTEGIVMIVPNRKMVSENLINWSANRNSTRFTIKVRAAYHADVEQVKKILIDCAKKHKQVQDEPSPFVRFKEFAESHLDFEILFWSDYLFPIEDLKSDLRFTIHAEFRKQGIENPFPKREVQLSDKNNEEE